MSTIAEQAAAEADAAEAEFPDEEDVEAEQDEDEPEPEAEVDAAQVLSEKDREKIIVKLDNEGDRHTKRVAEILGADVSDLAPCPLCWEHAQGFVLDGVPVDEVTAAMTRQVLGIADTPQYKDNPEFQMCEVCDGLGNVLSGSKVKEQLTVPCPKCTNKGFNRVPLIPVYEAPAWTPPPAPAFTPPGAPAGVSPNGDAPPMMPPTGWTPEPSVNGNDAYGRWPGHSNYGIPLERTGGRW